MGKTLENTVYVCMYVCIVYGQRLIDNSREWSQSSIWKDKVENFPKLMYDTDPQIER
jgi:hypothetical protein